MLRNLQFGQILGGKWYYNPDKQGYQVKFYCDDYDEVRIMDNVLGEGKVSNIEWAGMGNGQNIEHRGKYPDGYPFYTIRTKDDTFITTIKSNQLPQPVRNAMEQGNLVFSDKFKLTEDS